MRNADGKTIDWARTEERARSMTAEQLWGALVDIWKTLESADAMDRFHESREGPMGGWRGGYYRDEASVYHAEMARRRCR